MGAFSREGGKVLRTQVPGSLAAGFPAPGVGTDWTLTAPGRAALRVKSVTARLTTSAVVGNRWPQLVLTDGVETLAILPALAVQVASTVVTYTWMDGALAVNSGAGGAQSMALAPNLHLDPGFTLGTSTLLRDVGDQWDRLAVWTEEVPAYGEGAEVETETFRLAARLETLFEVIGNNYGNG